MIIVFVICLFSYTVKTSGIANLKTSDLYDFYKKRLEWLLNIKFC